MHITLDNLHLSSSRLVNNVFRWGYILGFPATGQVVGYYLDQPKLSGVSYGRHRTFRPLPSYRLPGLIEGETKQAYAQAFGKTLKLRYPNCRVRLVDLAVSETNVSHALIHDAITALGGDQQTLTNVPWWPKHKIQLPSFAALVRKNAKRTSSISTML